VFINCLSSCCRHLLLLAVVTDSPESKASAELLRLESGNVVLL
jgi:hypothetical protein